MKRYFFLCGILSLILIYISFFQTIADADNLYRVGINDVIDIKVLDHPELTSISTVSADGTIMFPYIGSVNVKGLNLTQIEEKIKKMLSDGYVKYPVLSVSLLQSMSRKIYAYGELMKRGTIPYEEKMTLEKAVSVAGGISNSGLFGKIVIRRKGEESGEYKDIVEARINNGNIEDKHIKSTLLNPDDIIMVERDRSYLVQGEVASRGRFVLEKNMKLITALLKAGGVSADGRFGKIKVKRLNAEGVYDNVAESNLDEGVIEDKDVENMILESDDIVVVERNNSFLVQGEMANRGRFVLEKDMTLLRALLQAGGVSKDGLYGKITIRRKQDESQEHYMNIGESNLEGGVIVDKEIENILLQPDDILVVEKNKTFFIYGEAQKTGEFTLKNNMTVFSALTIAGGLTKWGSESRVKILRTNKNRTKFETIKVNIKDVIDGDAAADVHLQSGDIIIVSASLL